MTKSVPSSAGPSNCTLQAGTAVFVGVALGSGVAVAVGVALGSGVKVGDGVNVGVKVGRNVGVGVAVLVGVKVGGRVGVSNCSGVAGRVGLAVGVPGVVVGTLVNVGGKGSGVFVFVGKTVVSGGATGVSSPLSSPNPGAIYNNPAPSK
ncbi:MAG TPA: hypothetical protein EYP41_08130 [Anaerolineae bacterium]|nr:hypothetical protein [Anaerolineae bacterium]HIP72125.1 hypothetical protein [Anaerolineae bacterium]